MCLDLQLKSIMELEQLLEDISLYMDDVIALKAEAKEQSYCVVCR